MCIRDRYLVTDSTGRTDDDFLSILEKALTGGVTLVQLREKERGGGEYPVSYTHLMPSKSKTIRSDPGF